MKVVCFLLISCFFIRSNAVAKDYGTVGHTFPIVEKDILQIIQTKLQNLDENGQLQHHQNEIVQITKRSLENPPAVKGLTRAIRDRVYSYDPSIILPYDLKDHEGRVFHKAGTRANPLETMRLPTQLVFIQGHDEAQVKWIEETYLNASIKVKIILVSGSPFDLMNAWGKPVYFDQGGIITTKLGIKSVPAIVKQKGSQLKISEIYIKEAPR